MMNKSDLRKQAKQALMNAIMNASNMVYESDEYAGYTDEEKSAIVECMEKYEMAAYSAINAVAEKEEAKWQKQKFGDSSNPRNAYVLGDYRIIRTRGRNIWTGKVMSEQVWEIFADGKKIGFEFTLRDAKEVVEKIVKGGSEK